MSYTMYTPLNVWLDPASVTDVVAHIQEYLTEYPLINQSDIEQIVIDYITTHPELVGGVDSVNGKTGEVVLTASDINTSNNTTIQAVLTALSGQISEIVQTITGLDTRVTANATGITNEATARANADTALGNRITALQGAVGSPLVAATAAAMTDTTKIYVYTGSESGYTNGNWYYYNGSAWTSGGVYNATAINTDTTLTIAGMAADAKATGDGLNDLKSNFDEIAEINNLFVKADATIGSRLDTGGYPFTDATCFLSDYISVELGKTYYKNSPILDGYHRMATYDRDHGMLRVINGTNEVTIEGTEVYVRFCGLLTEINTATFGAGKTAVDSVAREEIEEIKERDYVPFVSIQVAEKNGYAFSLNDKGYWEQGALTLNGGVVTESDSFARIRTTGYIQDLMPDVDTLKAMDGYQIIQFSFNDDDSYASLGEWTTEITGIISDKKMRIVARKNPESNISIYDSYNIGALRYNISRVDNIANIESYINTLCESRSENGFADIKEKFGVRVQKYIDDHGSVVDGVTKTYDEMYEWLLNRGNCIYNGALHKNGINIVNSSGNNVVLHGIGTHYLLDYNSLHTTESIETLKYYGINCIRLTAYTSDNSFIDSAGNDGLSRKFCEGYISKPNETKAVMDDLIEKCIDLGLYCIVDWHILQGQDARTISSEMNDFFSYFSDKYKNTPNVIYELLNEPFSNTAAQLADTMKGAYNIIRANAPSAIIVTGIGSDGVAPMISTLSDNGMTDVFVSAHYYQTGSGTDVSTYVQNYYNANYPMFYTEWGNANADGAGTYYDSLSQSLMDKFDTLGLSNCCWKFTYQNMATGTLKWSLLAMRGNGYQYGGFNEAELSHNGKFYFGNYQNYLFK